MEFKYAITRTPGRSMVNGITSVDLGKPDFHKALLQHQEYIRVLEYCGLEVNVLDAVEGHPDACFVEDVALLIPGLAIITNPGVKSRKLETKHIFDVLTSTHEMVKQITPPGTIEGGDIMKVEDTFFIGISERTNIEGFNQVSTILKQRGFKATMVELKEMLHLKTGLSYLEHNNLLITGEFIENPLFNSFNKLIVSEEEPCAANAIWINDHVLMPQGFPNTQQMVEDKGYDVITIDVSEFRKIDGGLSCLSLRF